MFSACFNLQTGSGHARAEYWGKSGVAAVHTALKRSLDEIQSAE